MVGVYLEKQKSEEEFYGSDVRVENLQQRRKELLEEINNAVERQTALGQELGLTTFEEKFLNPYDKALIDGNDALAAARRHRMEAEAKLNALNTRHKQQQALELASAAREMLANDRGLGDLNTLVAQRRNALVAKMSGTPPQNIRDERNSNTKLPTLTPNSLRQLRRPSSASTTRCVKSAIRLCWKSKLVSKRK